MPYHSRTEELQKIYIKHMEMAEKSLKKWKVMVYITSKMVKARDIRMNEALQMVPNSLQQ